MSNKAKKGGGPKQDSQSDIIDVWIRTPRTQYSDKLKQYQVTLADIWSFDLHAPNIFDFPIFLYY